LCGADVAERPGPRKKPTTESYQADVRKLREQLKKIRDEGAEAV
jgi:ribosomal protein L19E